MKRTTWEWVKKADQDYVLAKQGSRSKVPVRRGLLFLSDFAVDTRYPGSNASKRQAVAALRWAERVRTPARALLGM